MVPAGFGTSVPLPDDQLIPPAEAQAAGAAIPDARLQILPDAGHLLNLEQPEPFNEAVRGFMSSVWG